MKIIHNVLKNLIKISIKSEAMKSEIFVETEITLEAENLFATSFKYIFFGSSLCIFIKKIISFSHPCPKPYLVLNVLIQILRDSRILLKKLRDSAESLESS